MAFTLLHTADFHLGKSFSELPPERAGQRRADLLATLTRICHQARELKVDLLCIAGDLFDRPNPAPPLLAAARRALAEADIPVLVIPGNHDPLDEGSPFLDSHWPEKVTLAASPGWQRVPFEHFEVWAFGYARGEAHRNPWHAFPGCSAGALLVLHAACLCPGLAAEASYYPFPPNDIPACGYLALGHHHRPVEVSRSPAAWYAGAPEPLEPEMTPTTTLLVTLDGSSTKIEPLDLATRHHRLRTLEVTGLTAAAIWDRALAETSADDLLWLQLTGLLDPAESLDLSALHTELNARCFAAEIDTRELHLPVESISGEGALGTLGEIVRRRLDPLSPDDPQRLRVERAWCYAVLALEGKL